MGLSEKDIQRIKDEEKVRFEARKELLHHLGGCGKGWRCHCHKGGFWRGLFLGILLIYLFGWLVGRPYATSGARGWCQRWSAPEAQEPSAGPAVAPKK